MDKLIKIYLIIWLVGSVFAFIAHFFYPNLISNLSFWSGSDGWQREIALWNLGIIVIIIYTLIKKEVKMYKFMALILIIISLLLGINHLFELIINQEIVLINLFGAVLNLMMAIFGGFILKNGKN